MWTSLLLIIIINLIITILMIIIKQNLIQWMKPETRTFMNHFIQKLRLLKTSYDFRNLLLHENCNNKCMQDNYIKKKLHLTRQFIY